VTVLYVALKASFISAGVGCASTFLVFGAELDAVFFLLFFLLLLGESSEEVDAEEDAGDEEEEIGEG
jgi:hypothetical protein